MQWRMAGELRPRCGHDFFAALRNVSNSSYKKIKFVNSHLGISFASSTVRTERQKE